MTLSHAVAEHTESQNPLAEKRHAERVMRLLVMFSAAGIILLGMIYLTVLNRVATRGFDLEEMKGERVAILKNLDAAEIQATLPSSLYGLQVSEQFQGMEKIGKAKFFELEQGEMAMLYTEK